MPPLLRAALVVVVVTVAVAVGYAVGSASGGDSTPADDSAAAGFARDMSVHHAQAVEMAEIIRDRTDDEDLRVLATDIALTQQAQIGRMRGWLDAWDLPASRSEPFMGWAGMNGEMMGMASDDEVRELATLPIGDAERHFLELMISHHQGGVMMAQAAIDADVPGDVALLARGIVEAQTAEIQNLERMLTDRESA